MSLIKKYMQEANFSAMERWNNADGFIDDDLQFTANENYMGADAQGMGYSPAPTSQPYIITVSNASATSVSNFDVLGAYQYLQTSAGTFTNGSLTISNCVISSAISNITYQEFLYQSMNSPFSVGLTYIEVITGTNSQVSQTMTLNTRDANGNQALKTLVPTIDPYQQQTNIVAMKQNYRIDGFTKLTIATVLASTVFRLHFYPADNINIARGLAGRPVSRQFGSPNIVRSSVAVIGGDTVQSRLG
ncbi:MAG: hypothetical protein EBR55_00185 [Chitinophagia bacterium]|jgi:hypothetical protein|nr:hypothetical protein [Chitinophagia bacterium]